jgi:8-oxo-dGTP pyrophosphatase MutT (NUDIX family)
MLALKRAAVAIALTEADDAAGGTAVLLTLRAAGLRAHSSQWALPGGRCDEGETQVTAALRELHEELGLDLREANVLGLLDDYPTRSGYLITPVVVWADASAAIAPNPEEVASVHRIALGDIERADAFDFTTIPESTRRVIRFRHAGQFIHAPTAALIYQFREVRRPRYPRCRAGTAGICLEVGA